MKITIKASAAFFAVLISWLSGVILSCAWWLHGTFPDSQNMANHLNYAAMSFIFSIASIGAWLGFIYLLMNWKVSNA